MKIRCAQWTLRLDQHAHYELIGAKLFEARRGGWQHILSFCLDDPEQGPVVVLPIMQQVVPTCPSSERGTL